MVRHTYQLAAQGTLLLVNSVCYIAAALPSRSLGAHASPGLRSAFIPAGIGAPTLASALEGRLRQTATCSRARGMAGGGLRMADTSAGTSAAGTVGSYMSKIPAHLQGLAIRNQKKELHVSREEQVRPVESDDDQMSKDIMAELDDEDDDRYDFAKEVLESEDFDAMQYRGKLGDAQIDDALVLRQLQSSMHPDDFIRVFGSEVGELL
mmetsp:Transcript_44218/g.105303  ORF Transcript_44218/g.105303 Transcript_44218/m.105303 type:complete len:208 (-) Transcript_44218:120-743(-)